MTAAIPLLGTLGHFYYFAINFQVNDSLCTQVTFQVGVPSLTPLAHVRTTRLLFVRSSEPQCFSGVWRRQWSEGSETMHTPSPRCSTPPKPESDTNPTGEN